MLAAFYTRTGPAREVLTLGEIDTPAAGPGEVRVKLACSGVNPSAVKTRGGVRSRDLPFPRIVPHSDGAGVIDAVGAGVPVQRVGERVWLWNAAWGRAMGTAAEYVVLPSAQAVPLPDGRGFDAGACLGIPAKFMFIAAVSTLGSLTRVPYGGYRQVPEARALLTEAMGEVVAVTRAKGVSLEADIVRKTLAFIDGSPPDIKPSMQRDVEAGRVSELESMIGIVVRSGAELGVPTPMMRFSYGVLKPGYLQARGGG